jgi:hypothetical protein
MIMLILFAYHYIIYDEYPHWHTDGIFGQSHSKYRKSPWDCTIVDFILVMKLVLSRQIVQYP